MISQASITLDYFLVADFKNNCILKFNRAFINPVQKRRTCVPCETYFTAVRGRFVFVL